MPTTGLAPRPASVSPDLGREMPDLEFGGSQQFYDFKYPLDRGPDPPDTGRVEICSTKMRVTEQNRIPSYPSLLTLDELIIRDVPHLQDRSSMPPNY